MFWCFYHLTFSHNLALVMSGDVLVGLFAGGVVGGVVGGGIIEILKAKQSHFEALRGRTIEVCKGCVNSFSIHTSKEFQGRMV